MNPKQRLVEQCYGCKKAGFTVCKVFKDPAYQHRRGRKCYGYSNDTDWEIKVKRAVDFYSGKKIKPPVI